MLAIGWADFLWLNIHILDQEKVCQAEDRTMAGAHLPLFPRGLNMKFRVYFLFRADLGTLYMKYHI
jgi:hypothetical protein